MLSYLFDSNCRVIATFTVNSQETEREIIVETWWKGSMKWERVGEVKAVAQNHFQISRSQCVVQKVVGVTDCSESSLILSSAADTCRSVWNDVETVFIGSILNYLCIWKLGISLLSMTTACGGSLIMNTIYK